MSDQELSLLHGKPRNYLSEIKWRNPDFYHLLKDMGISKYEDEASALRAKLASIYYEIKDSKQMSMADFFRRELTDCHATVHAFCTWLNHNSFVNIDTTTQYRSYIRCMNVIEKYEKYKGDKQ